MNTHTDNAEMRKFRYGAYDLRSNRVSALEDFGINPEEIEKIDTEMKKVCGMNGKKWSINCFDDAEEMVSE